jgi:prolyl-tRNA editing enzyme YbaK/EbsC (Cys-tRNA(Pro) deacylase)
MDVDRVAELQRWEESGAVWSLVSRTKDRVTIALLRCDGGEEVDRFTSDDPRLLEYVGASVEAVELGKLVFVPVVEALELVGEPVRQHIERCGGDGLWVSEIDPDLADTQAFCEHYDVGLDISANCVVAEAKRADRVWHVACMVLATTRADVNGIVRKHVDARKISFASMDTAVSLTGMEYGGITPIGLPAGWPILVDENVADQQRLIIGSGIRGSKLLASGDALIGLPGAEVLALTKA